MKQLRNKSAVIIAGGAGIGRSMALAFAREGMSVVVADIRLDAAEQVRDEIRALGRRSIAVRTDATKVEDVRSLADTAYSEFDSVELLCNNAGVAVRPFRAVWDTSYADFKYMIDTNIWSLVHGVREFVPRMRDQPGEKHMVNTSSMGCLFIVPGNATYSLTKSAVDSFSDVIREELRPYGFGVTTLFPGLVNTGAAQLSGQLRSAEEKAADTAVRPYHSYAAERGEVIADVGAGRGPVVTIGAGQASVPIDPELVGPMVVRAVKANRPYCMTHPVPDGIKLRYDALMDGYHANG